MNTITSRMSQRGMTVLLGGLVVLLVSGCTLGGNTPSGATGGTTNTTNTGTTPGAAGATGADSTKKVGTTTKTGTISKAGDKYLLQQTGKAPQELDSYAVDLSQYVGKQVTIVGQFSGDTLFVGEVK